MNRICIILSLSCLIALGGCKSGSRQISADKTEFEMAMTSRDTIEVRRLIDMFFEKIEDGRIAIAIATLYYLPTDDRWSEPQLLDNEQMAKAKAAFDAFPITDHRIDYIKFHEMYANEAKITAILAHGGENMPEISTVIYLKPVNYKGNWRLCLMDTLEGDEPLVSNEKRDSLAGEFENSQLGK